MLIPQSFPNLEVFGILPINNFVHDHVFISQILVDSNVGPQLAVFESSGKLPRFIHCTMIFDNAITYKVNNCYLEVFSSEFAQQYLFICVKIRILMM